MNLLFLCPANTVSGGPESIHNMVALLNQIDKVDAKILYIGNMVNPQPQQYEEYRCPWIVQIPTDYDGIVVFPDIWANWVNRAEFVRYKHMILWLGVDTYKNRCTGSDYGEFLKDKNCLHVVQTAYAEWFLLSQNVEPDRIFKLPAVINKLFTKPYTEKSRDDVVLYNPAKLTNFQQRLMNSAMKQGVEFKPIHNLTKEQVRDIMCSAKLYIDFGMFPGRERLPREAAACGCCVITGKYGAAKYFEDVCITNDYKFDGNDDEIPQMVKLMKNILAHYNTYKPDFTVYRDAVIKDTVEMPNRLKKLLKWVLWRFYEIQHNSSSI